MTDWISVKDKTPGKDGNYLIFYGDSALLKAKLYEREQAVGIAYWSEKRNCWWEIEMNRTTPYITHWMPLPEPPKEEV